MLLAEDEVLVDRDVEDQRLLLKDAADAALPGIPIAARASFPDRRGRLADAT